MPVVGARGSLRAVTDTASPAYGDAIDVFVSPKNIPGARSERRKRGERFWTYNGRPPEAGSMILDAEGIALRTWGWIAERYDIELWYAWEGLYFSDRYNGGGPTDLLRQPITFDERRRGGSDWGNGDGVLAYPGPLPSLRLKVLRTRSARPAASPGAREVRAAGPRAGNCTQRRSESAGRGKWDGPLGCERDLWESARGAVLDAIEAGCP